MKDKVVLITGGTSGIGRATAIAFARKGAKVLVTGRRKEEGEETVALIKKEGGTASFFKADVSKEDDNRLMVEEVLKQYGKLDFAFNNAGVEEGFNSVTEATEENFHHIMNINVLGVLMSMKYEIRAMQKNGGGSIVNMASVAGLIGMAGVATYVASKHAVIGLTKTAALEVAKEKIRINSVSPAGVETDMYQRFTGGQQAFIEQMKALHPIGRVGQPEEIASAVLYLASPEASFVTGTNFVLDGGMTAQ